MKMQKVKSSNVAAVGFDDATGMMHVEFKNGHKYEYRGVSPAMHSALVGASSIGKHLSSQASTKWFKTGKKL